MFFAPSAQEAVVLLSQKKNSLRFTRKKKEGGDSSKFYNFRTSFFETEHNFFQNKKSFVLFQKKCSVKLFCSVSLVADWSPSQEGSSGVKVGQTDRQKINETKTKQTKKKTKQNRN